MCKSFPKSNQNLRGNESSSHPKSNRRYKLLDFTKKPIITISVRRFASFGCME